MLDGTKVAIAVKPEQRRESSGIDRIIEKFREKRNSGFADLHVVRSREQITHDMGWNARLIIWARRLRDAAETEALARLLESIHGEVALSSVLDVLGNQDGGFIAAVNLLDLGHIQLTRSGRLAHDSHIRIVSNFSGEFQ